MNNNQDVLNEKQESQNKAHSVEIIVNGRSFEIAEKEIAFEELVKLAFGNVESNNNTAYTVTYSYKHGHNHDNGILVSGDTVKVKKGMVFNVTKTSRS